MDRRSLLGGFAAGAALPFPSWAKGARWDVIVDPAGAAGTVPTLGAALERAVAAEGKPFAILLRNGVYREKPSITLPNLTISGGGQGTVLVYGAYAGQAHEGGTWGTSGSATLAVSAPGTTLRYLTIRNDFDYIGAKRDAAGNGAQAVALRIDPAADRTRLEQCRLEGYQDTLYVQARSHLLDCRIVGGVDFIFGGAAAWFERCEIVTRFVAGASEFGFIAAPSTPLAQPYGLIFADCRLTHEAGVPPDSTWLGRPWRAGGNMSLTGQAIYLRCWLDAHIKRAGWTSMGYKGPNGTRPMLAPQDARLFEYASEGPGSGPASVTRRFLTPDEAKRFTRAEALGGW